MFSTITYEPNPLLFIRNLDRWISLEIAALRLISITCVNRLCLSTLPIVEFSSENSKLKAVYCFQHLTIWFFGYCIPTISDASNSVLLSLPFIIKDQFAVHPLRFFRRISCHSSLFCSGEWIETITAFNSLSTAFCESFWFFIEKRESLTGYRRPLRKNRNDIL